jgi:uncharacterized SAM-binding protein YcdF (DUF218 family)
MFFLAKLISILLSPLPLSLALLATGLLLLWFTKRQMAGKAIVTGGFLILILFSFSFVSDSLLKPIEARYPPLMSESDILSGRNHLPQAKWIVVLGGGHVSDPHLPVTSQISPGSLIRLTEGVRLHRKLPGSKMILMGGPVFDPVPEVETEAKVAEIMNVSHKDLILEKRSKDTEEQAQNIKAMVGNDPFILVTSAAHMPRSVALFKKTGLTPIPAPTNHRVIQRQDMSPDAFIPSLGGIGKAENAMYENLCMVWSKMRGKI